MKYIQHDDKNEKICANAQSKIYFKLKMNESILYVNILHHTNIYPADIQNIHLC